MNFTYFYIFFFTDPTKWNDEHIESWLKWCTQQLELWPVPNPSDFPKTGNELCSFERNDFERCTRNRRTAKLLFVHLSHLKHSITGRPLSPSLMTAVQEEGKLTEICHGHQFIFSVSRKVRTHIQKVMVTYIDT